MIHLKTALFYILGSMILMEYGPRRRATRDIAQNAYKPFP